MVERIKAEILRRKAAADKQAQNINGLEVYYLGESDLCASLLAFIEAAQQEPCASCGLFNNDCPGPMKRDELR